MAYTKLYQEIRKWKMFEDAIKDLQDDDVIVMGCCQTVRMLH